jgi:hypothetical protein
MHVYGANPLTKLFCSCCVENLKDDMAALQSALERELAYLSLDY